jgi:beta-galactosidase
MGAKGRTADNASPRTWTIPFEKGSIKAVAKNNGKIVAEQELKTASKTSKIILTADKSSLKNNWDDVVYVTATITDEDGIMVSNADQKINFEIEGPGIIAAVDNGDITSAEPYQATSRWTYKGRCVAIVKASAIQGKITIKANGENLKSGSVTINSVQ